MNLDEILVILADKNSPRGKLESVVLNLRYRDLNDLSKDDKEKILNGLFDLFLDNTAHHGTISYNAFDALHKIDDLWLINKLKSVFNLLVEKQDFFLSKFYKFKTQKVLVVPFLIEQYFQSSKDIQLAILTALIALDSTIGLNFGIWLASNPNKIFPCENYSLFEVDIVLDNYELSQKIISFLVNYEDSEAIFNNVTFNIIRKEGSITAIKTLVDLYVNLFNFKRKISCLGDLLSILDKKKLPAPKLLPLLLPVVFELENLSDKSNPIYDHLPPSDYREKNISYSVNYATKLLEYISYYKWKNFANEVDVAKIISANKNKLSLEELLIALERLDFSCKYESCESIDWDSCLQIADLIAKQDVKIALDVLVKILQKTIELPDYDYDDNDYFQGVVKRLEKYQKQARSILPQLKTLLPDYFFNSRRSVSDYVEYPENISYYARILETISKIATEEALPIALDVVDYYPECGENQDGRFYGGEEFRITAAEILGKNKVKEAVIKLNNILYDYSEVVAHKAAWALGEIASKEALLILLEHINGKRFTKNIYIERFADEEFDSKFRDIVQDSLKKNSIKITAANKFIGFYYYFRANSDGFPLFDLSLLGDNYIKALEEVIQSDFLDKYLCDQLIEFLTEKDVEKYHEIINKLQILSETLKHNFCLECGTANDFNNKQCVNCGSWEF